MRFLSLFSGIEAASAAWLPLGWECAAVAEIEPFPCAVLAHHYPDIPNLGDITQITEADIKAIGHIDLVVGGFPCQDLSDAGKRKGLMNEDGSVTRSGLFFQAMRIVRWAGARFVLLENVPGIYSSNGGRDFAAVVGEILGVEFAVPAGGWENSGVAASERGLFEWATLDAQYFGVAQRRRRMFALGDFGDWSSRPPVLFERDSLSGNPAPSREAGKVAPTIPSRSTGGGGLGTDFDLDGGLQAWPAAVAPTLDAHYGDKMGLENQHINAGGGCSFPTVAMCLNAGAMGRQDAESETLIPTIGGGFDAPVPYAVQAGALRQNPSSGPDGVGVQEHIAYTLEARAEVQAVAFVTTQITSASNFSSPKAGDPCHPLAAGAHAPAIAFQPGNLSRGAGSAPSEMLFPTLKSDHGRGKSDQDPHVMHGAAVRRLTPRECERLQGFRDDFTLIPVRGKPAADGPRYKALGNSMAVPVMRWIGERIQQVASLQGAEVAA